LVTPNFLTKNTHIINTAIIGYYWREAQDCQINFYFYQFKKAVMKFPFLYFDPGTGALVVQLLVAAGAAVTLFYKKITTGVKSLFGKKQDQDLMGDIDIEEKKDADDNK
jgi:hypothetical protein